MKERKTQKKRKKGRERERERESDLLGAHQCVLVGRYRRPTGVHDEGGGRWGACEGYLFVPTPLTQYVCYWHVK